MPFLLSPGNTSSRTSRPPTHHYIFLTSFLFWSTAKWAQLFYCNGRGEFRAPTLLLCLATRKPSLLYGDFSPVIRGPPDPHVLFHVTIGSWAASLHWVIPNQMQDFCWAVCVKRIFTEFTEFYRRYCCPKKFKTKLGDTSRWDRKKKTVKKLFKKDKSLKGRPVRRLEMDSEGPWRQMQIRELLFNMWETDNWETQMQEWVIEINKAIVLEGYLTVRHKNKRMIESKIRLCTTLGLLLISSFSYLFFHFWVSN